MNARNKESKSCCADFESTCRGSQETFEEIMKYCGGKGNFTDCSAMMEGMMQMCCRPKAGDTKEDCTRC